MVDAWVIILPSSLWSKAVNISEQLSSCKGFILGEYGGKSKHRKQICYKCSVCVCVIALTLDLTELTTDGLAQFQLRLPWRLPALHSWWSKLLVTLLTLWRQLSCGSLSVLYQSWEHDPSDVISLAFQADRVRLCCKLTARRSNKRQSGWFMVNFRLSGFEAFSHLVGSKPWHICSCFTNLYNYFHNLTRSTPTALLDGNSKSLVLITVRGMQSVANHCPGNTAGCLVWPIIILIKFSGRCLLKNNNYNSQLSFLSSFRVSFIHMWLYLTTQP